ncbi:hypothetical protein V8F20_003314 [Naviculisporaceae sp. PSN 640]
MASVLLVDRLPTLGFHWPKDLGSPRVLRADHRDAAVMAALLAVAGSGGHVRPHQALAALEQSWDFLSQAFQSAQLGILDAEDMVSWLFRVRRLGGDPLASAIRPNLWVEFVYQVVMARNRYLSEEPKAKQLRNFHRLPGLAHAVDRFWAIAHGAWNRDHSQLFLFAEPDLFGLSNDWDGDEEEWGLEEDEEMKGVTAELVNLAVDEKKEDDKAEEKVEEEEEEKVEEEDDEGEPMDLSLD